jgi:hypothetical protein
LFGISTSRRRSITAISEFALNAGKEEPLEGSFDDAGRGGASNEQLIKSSS